LRDFFVLFYPTFWIFEYYYLYLPLKNLFTIHYSFVESHSLGNMYTEKKLHNKITKRVLFIVLCIVIISCVAFVYVFRLSYKENERALADQCEQYSASQRDAIINTIEAEMAKVEISALNVRASVFGNGSYITKDSAKIFDSFEHVLDANPQISGVVASFEDFLFPEYAKRNGFIPLVRRTDSCYVRMQVGNVRDARHTLEWYAYHRDNNSYEGLWSEPFLSDDGVPITSYSLPMHDDKGRFVGVVAVDINLLDLATSVDKIKPYPSSSMAIVDSQLRFIVHPNREYIMHWTLPQAMKRLGINPDTYPLEHATQRLTGKTSVLMGSQPTFIFYGPIAKTRWSVMLYIPHAEVYDQLATLRDKMLLVAGIALGIILIASAGLVWLFLQRPRKRRRGFYSDDDEMYDDDAFMKTDN